MAEIVQGSKLQRCDSRCFGLSRGRMVVQKVDHRRNVVPGSLIFPQDLPKVSLLGLLAKIMCSICSCQLNIWHVGHRPTPILN